MSSGHSKIRDLEVPESLEALALADRKTGRRLAQIWQPRGFSSRRRIKPERGAAHYHVMSRTVNGEFLFGPVEKEAFRRMMWRMAKFAGVEILTYAVMDNHFHILLKVPDREKWLRRFEPRKGEAAHAGEERLIQHLASVYSEAFLKQLGNELRSFRERGMETAAQDLLERFKRRFCDVSLFVKELKERFSRWFNKQQGRRGTLWMDRFQSVCVDGEAALSTMAAYIDLNPVRAGLVEDPMDYAWSGCGEAARGSRRARRGLCKALHLPQNLWEERGLPRYRLFLYDQGVAAAPGSTSSGQGQRNRRGVGKEARQRVKKSQGKISTAKYLRERVATFSNGVAIGTPSFVDSLAAQYRDVMSRKRKRKPRVLKEGDDFVVMRE